jgi:type I restriction enzyme S subunit
VLQTANPEVLIPEYLPFVLQNDRFWDYAVEHKHGSTNFFINWSTLADYEFELPSVEEQNRVATLAWAAHRLKKENHKLIEATDNLVKSQFIGLKSTRFSSVGGAIYA